MKPTSAARRWLVLCDFDGTISQGDVTDSLLLRFGRDGWQALERQWLDGTISSRQCMAGQIALLGCSREELDAHIAGMAIDADFGRFVDAVRCHGSSLAIVSDGLDHVIRAMLGRAGIAGVPVLASHLVQVGPRRWRLQFPHARAGCTSASATCKCSWARDRSPRPVLLIGDGISDVCVAAEAAEIFARDRLLGFCIDSGRRHRRVASFAEAICAWHELTRNENARREPHHPQDIHAPT